MVGERRAEPGLSNSGHFLENEHFTLAILADRERRRGGTFQVLYELAVDESVQWIRLSISPFYKMRSIRENGVKSPLWSCIRPINTEDKLMAVGEGELQASGYGMGKSRG